MPVLPTARGVYLCQRVDVDPGTKDLSLVRCFRTLVRDPASGSAGPFFVVAVLANGVGSLQVSARVNRLDTMAEVYAAWVTVPFVDRLQDVRFKLLVEQCRFPIPGDYEVSLWAGGDMLAQIPFRVRDRKEG